MHEFSHIEPYSGSRNQLSRNRLGPPHRALQSRRATMEHYVGLDVSLKLRKSRPNRAFVTRPRQSSIVWGRACAFGQGHRGRRRELDRIAGLQRLRWAVDHPVLGIEASNHFHVVSEVAAEFDRLEHNGVVLAK